MDPATILSQAARHPEYFRYSALLGLALLIALPGCDTAPATTPTNPTVMNTPTTPSTLPFPVELPYTKEEIPKLFMVLDVEQDPDSAMHFGIFMPMGWKQVPGVRQLITPQNAFGLRTEVKAPSGPEATIKVFLAYISQEISPSDWLTMSLEAQKEQVLHERYFAQPGGAVPDVLTIGGPAGARRISRWLVLKNWAKIGGAHFFIVQASTPEANYTPEMANVFFMAVSNFKVMHPTEWDYAEQLRTLVQPAPAKISTLYPLSWQQQDNPNNEEHFYQVKLTRQIEGRSIGLVNLMVAVEQDKAKMRQLEDESRRSYQLADNITFAPATLVAAPKFGSFDEVYTALNPQTNAAADMPAQERQVLMARSGAYWILMENLRFTRQADPVAWAISKRGFEIVQDNLVIKP